MKKHTADKRESASIHWRASWRDDPEARELADRHYNRQSPGASGFVPPGRCLVLKTRDVRAYWVTSWPFAKYVKHEWPGAWMCSAFRNEGAQHDGAAVLSSELIDAAVACTLWEWPDAPSVAASVGAVAFVTFVDAEKVRRKRDPGRCYRRAGWVDIGRTKGGLLALGLPVSSLPVSSLPVSSLPSPTPFAGSQTEMFERGAADS